MSIQETQDHTASLLGHDAEQIAVGPPPLARIVADGRRGRRRRALGVGVAAAALVAVGAVGLGQLGIGPGAGDRSQVAAPIKSTIIPGVPDPVEKLVERPAGGALQFDVETTSADGTVTNRAWVGEPEEAPGDGFASVTVWTRTGDTVDKVETHMPAFVVRGTDDDDVVRSFWTEREGSPMVGLKNSAGPVLGKPKAAPSFKAASLRWIIENEVGTLGVARGTYHGVDAFAIDVESFAAKDRLWFDLKSWQFIGQVHERTGEGVGENLPDFESFVTTKAVDAIPADVRAKGEAQQ